MKVGRSAARAMPGARSRMPRSGMQRPAAARQALVFGKPAPDFFQAALASMGCAPSEAVMVGDDAESDIGGAVAVKMKAVLVRTGKYEPGAESAYALPPTCLADDLAAAADWILAGNT